MRGDSNLNSMLREAVLLVGLAIGVGLTVNIWHPHGLNLLAPPRVGESANDPLQITLEEATRHHSERSAKFIDARSSADYATGHILGAMSGPDREFDRWIEGFLAENDPDIAIVAYCDGVQCELSRALVEKLRELGYVNARYLPDGWGRWKSEGLPVGMGAPSS